MNVIKGENKRFRQATNHKKHANNSYTQGLSIVSMRIFISYNVMDTEHGLASLARMHAHRIFQS